MALVPSWCFEQLTSFLRTHHEKISILALLAVAYTAFAQKTEADFAGYYAGAQLGFNHSTEMKVGKEHSKNSAYPGHVVGHNTADNGVIYGVEGFADFHKKSSTRRDFGMGFKAGKVVGDVLVYGRLGVTGLAPSYRPQVGVGAEYLIDKNPSLNALLSHDHLNEQGIHRNNTSMAVDLNYHLR